MTRPLEITASVGAGGKNLEDDVRAVQERLHDLGFDWILVDGRPGPITTSCIQLFQSIIYGRQTIGGDGRVDVGLTTHRWLEAENAPRWMLLPELGIGYVNVERGQEHDHHDWGTSWLDGVIRTAARAYQEAYAAEHGASPIAINDASPPQGGDSRDHAGHETGLACDGRMPIRGGKIPPGGLTWRDRRYDRQAMRAQLVAFDGQGQVRRVFFNDPNLVADGLCKHVPGHDDHWHLEISVPTRE